MRNLLLILLCVVFTVGCGQTLKNSWSNFRAYYNTYYNAKENFRAGLKKVQDQPANLDPKEPVRIHPAPVQAGNSDFQKAIDKGAKILREFPQSKWADDAILMIGKSYYYRQEFYPALQKFEELRNATDAPSMKQRAIIWKGRAQLDLDLHNEAISFLESELSQYPAEWSMASKGEIQTLAGEHYAMLENWEASADLLSQAVSNIEQKKLMGRTLFLYGQVLERLERYGEAYFAFSRVSENFPGFEYTYWARVKQADVARKEGNLDQAIAIYRSLSKDDKNVQRRSDLAFEIARTLEMKGEVTEAEQDYRNLLYGKQNQASQSRSLRADIYYRLGKIYSEHYNNFSTAAAYFDSSSSISDNPRKIDASKDPQTLADAFGKYTRLQQTIQRSDSLLRLGALSPAALDSALAKIRAQKRKKLLRARESKSQNRLLNRNISSSGGDGQPSSSAYGFLNYRNPELASQAQTEFRIVWGNRPLIDNWRRMEVVRQSNTASSQSLDEAENKNIAAGKGQGTAVEMNLQDIPRNEKQKQRLKQEKVNAQYQLGNLLFLNLNSPDSARYYFHKVINSDSGDKLRPRAMYSLYELFKTTGSQDSLDFWGEKILQQYPDSRYARKIKSGPEAEENTPADSAQKMTRKYQTIMESGDENRAARLRKLALENRSSDLAPLIHYQSIEAYIRQAKAHDKLSDSLSVSAANIRADTLSTSDTTAFREFSISDQPEFKGAYWDSVRLVLHEFDTTFTGAPQQEKIFKLREMLKQSKSDSPMPTCRELGISLRVQPNMDEFLSTVTYPEKLQGARLSGNVEYSFVVAADGKIKSYDLVSKKTSLGIEEAFEKAFEQSLRFGPLQLKDPPKEIKCRVSFPVTR